MNIIIKGLFKGCMLIVFMITFTTAIVFARSEDFEKAQEQLKSIVTEKGYPPSLEDYIRIVINDTDKQLSSGEINQLWGLLESMQNPLITKDSLLTLISSKYSSLSDFLCDYEHKRELFDNKSDHSIQTVRYHLAMNNDSFIVDREPLSSIVNDRRTAVSSTKNCFIKVFYPSDNDNTYVNASLGAPSGDRSDQYQSMSPLSQSCLCDTTVLGDPTEFHDLKLFLSKPRSRNLIVFEDLVMYNSSKCLVLSDLSIKILLDVDKDFSVVGLIDYLPNIEDGPDGPTLKSLRIGAERSLSGLKSYGNAIWFPEKAVIDYFTDSGDLAMRDSVDYENIKVNSGLKDSYFSDVIPDGALVADSIRDMVYVWGDHPSIGSLIKETVKSKRQTIFRNLSLVLGLCFLACWGFIEWRKRRLLKENAE